MKKVFKDEHEQFCYNLGYQDAQNEFLDIIDEWKSNFNGYGLTIGTSHLYNKIEELKKAVGK